MKVYKVDDANSSKLGKLHMDGCRTVNLNGKMIFQFLKDADVVDAACSLMENIPCFQDEGDNLESILRDLRNWAKRRREPGSLQ